MSTLGHLEGFSYREAHPWELITSARGVFGKLDRMTWRSKWIARSENFSKKSLRAFSSRNPTKLGGGGERRWRGIMMNWVFRRNRLFGCHDEETKRERERERELQQKARHMKEKKWNVQCMNMLHAKITCIMGRNPIQPNSTPSV